MTEKRFTINTLDGSIDLRDNNKVMTYKEVVDLLNELYEERNYFERKKCEYWNKFNLAHLDNIQLRQENEQLKQFKEDVFNKIDMHLRMLPTARDNEFDEDDGDPSLYVGAIYMLETLKKELEE